MARRTRRITLTAPRAASARAPASTERGLRGLVHQHDRPFARVALDPLLEAAGELDEDRARQARERVGAGDERVRGADVQPELAEHREVVRVGRAARRGAQRRRRRRGARCAPAARARRRRAAACSSGSHCEDLAPAGRHARSRGSVRRPTRAGAPRPGPAPRASPPPAPRGAGGSSARRGSATPSPRRFEKPRRRRGGWSGRRPRTRSRTPRLRFRSGRRPRAAATRSRRPAPGCAPWRRS